MKKFKSFNDEYDVIVEKLNYPNGNLAINLVCYDKEVDCLMPFGTLTTNFEKKLPPNMAYVDTNNMPYAEEFIRKYGLGEHQGKFYYSGYCCYPLYKFYDDVEDSTEMLAIRLNDFMQNYDLYEYKDQDGSLEETIKILKESPETVINDLLDILEDICE